MRNIVFYNGIRRLSITLSNILIHSTKKPNTINLENNIPKKKKEKKIVCDQTRRERGTRRKYGNVGVRRVQRFQRGGGEDKPLAQGALRVSSRCRGGFVRAITGKTVINHGRSGESEATDKGMEGREARRRGKGVRRKENGKAGEARKVGTKEIYHRGYLDTSLEPWHN